MIVLAALFAPRLMLPPLVMVKFADVADLTIVPFVVTEPEREGAESVAAAVPDEIAPVERLPVEAVRVRPEFPIETAATVTEPPEIETVLPAVIAPVETDPLAAVSVKVWELMVVVVMLPAVAVAVRLLAAVIAPRLRLPVLDVTVMLVF